MKDRFKISERNPFKFEVSEITPWRFLITEMSPWQFILTSLDSDTTAPVLVTIILTSANTVVITYNEDLNESIIPANPDYVFNGDISTGIGSMKIGTTFIIA
jgi:hypothetical protein